MSHNEDRHVPNLDIEDHLNNIPLKAEETLKELSNKLSGLESFDMLSNIAVHNHIHETKEYKDFDEGKMFIISEVVALIALKGKYVEDSAVDVTDFSERIRDIQDLAFMYLNLETLSQSFKNRPKDENSIPGIAFKTMRDEIAIRNPGIPDHHLEISSELYKPFESQINDHFGFSIAESIQLRKEISRFLTNKLYSAIDKAKNEGHELTMEVLKFRRTKIVPENSSFDETTLLKLNQYSRKEMRDRLLNFKANNLFFKLGNVYSFTIEEVSEHTSIPKSIVLNFMKAFSCEFGDINAEDAVVTPLSILKTKPIIHYKERFLIPSLPLLTWCVEPRFEEFIKANNKIQNSFTQSRHDFLLNKGCELFEKILQRKCKIYKNLYYPENNDKSKICETDALIIYDRTLFIVEAKGQRITKQAKEGKINRTEKHLEEIVKYSYEQGRRTLLYIRANGKSEFKAGKNEEVVIDKTLYDNYILVSLTLEPIGNITPFIRATSALKYFEKGIFPFIISIYDLIVISDHIEEPVLLLHYIKKREEFLNREIMWAFDEMDLLIFYLHNRMYLERLISEGEKEKVNRIYYGMETDSINNYYMHKYLHKAENPPKVKPNIPAQTMSLIRSILNTSSPNKTSVILKMLSMGPNSEKTFLNNISKIKAAFNKDNSVHDCSIITKIGNDNIGFTFMTNPERKSLDGGLSAYCLHKLSQTDTSAWMGIGDINKSKSEFEITSVFLFNQK